MLLSNYSGLELECGTDEVGRGCGAGPVVAAAVILPIDYINSEITDSKKLSEKKRERLFDVICKDAITYCIREVSVEKIDEINILQASMLAMHNSISELEPIPEHILADGNQFDVYPNIPHTCIIKGDSKYLSIAAASILAKVYRDRLMIKLHDTYPMYDWHKNKGYLTKAHRAAIVEHGDTMLHRKTFKLI